MRSSSMRELAELAQLGWPIVVAQVAQMGNGVVDVLASGNYDKVDQAGVAIGSSLFWPIYLLVSGTIMALTPTVSQLNGGGRVRETGAVARQALWISLLGSVVAVFLLLNAKYLYEGIQVAPEAIPIAVDFLKIQCFAVLPLFLYTGLRSLCEGLAMTKPAMFIALIALLCKIPLTFWFVFGGFGIEPMGGVGCAVATSIIVWIQLCCIVVAILNTRIRFSGVFSRFDWVNVRVCWQLIKLGVPIGISIFVEVAFFASITLLAGKLGVESTSAHQSAMSIASIAFMFPLAFGFASTIRISANVGAQRYQSAMVTVKVIVSCAFWFGLFMGFVIFTFRDQLATLYSIDENVVALASSLLIYGALFQLFDATQATMQGALRGYKDTTVPACIALVSYWGIGLPVGWVAAFGGFGFEGVGVSGLYYGLILSLAVAAICLGTRLYYFSRNFVVDSRFRAAHLKL